MNDEIFFKIYYVLEKLKYLKNALEFLDKSLTNKMEGIEKNFTNAYHSIYLDDFKNNFYEFSNPYLPNDMLVEELECHYQNLSDEHESILSHIIQSILVRHVAIIEKLFKDLYDEINKVSNVVDIPLTLSEKIRKKGIKKVVCEMFCLNKKNDFSDIRTIVDMINKRIGINIKLVDNSHWTQLRIMNELRNRFAHGINKFIIKKDIYNDSKNTFGADFISIIEDKEKEYICKIGKNFNPLIKFNISMQSYIQQISKELEKQITIK